MIDLQKIKDLRKKLHENPEISNEEYKTREILKNFIKENSNVEIIDKKDWFYCIKKEEGATETIMLRADHDSIVNSKGEPFHGCGHDGHSAILVGAILNLENVKTGKNIIYLFQPAEENGTGAEICTPVFDEQDIDKVYGLHNMSGFEFGEINYLPGISQFASMGLTLDFTGLQSHASEPEKGKNPSFVIGKLITELEDYNELKKLSVEGEDKTETEVLMTIVEINVGGKNFGINPGKGTLSMTIRSKTMDDLEIFKDFILNKAKEIAGDIKIESKTFDVFHEVYCDPNLCKESIKTLDNAGFNTRNMGEAFRGSEDFGVYSNYAPSMFFYLGNGKDYTPLHNDNYEFSDDLLEVGIKLWTSIAKG